MGMSAYKESSKREENLAVEFCDRKNDPRLVKSPVNQPQTRYSNKSPVAENILHFETLNLASKQGDKMFKNKITKPFLCVPKSRVRAEASAAVSPDIPANQSDSRMAMTSQDAGAPANRSELRIRRLGFGQNEFNL